MIGTMIGAEIMYCLGGRGHDTVTQKGSTPVPGPGRDTVVRRPEPLAPNGTTMPPVEYTIPLPEVDTVMSPQPPTRDLTRPRQLW